MRILFLILGFILWSTLVFCAPDTVYWRDGGEFLLSAYFLDIAHPAGFPLYAQLSNLCALLPLGPAPWRVVLFSVLCAMSMCGLALCILNYFAPTRRFLLAQCAAFIVVIAMPSFLKQALAPEVYILNGVFILGAVLIVLVYGSQKDQRLPLCLAFLTGVAAANHVASLCALIPLCIFMLVRWKESRALIPFGTLFFLSGILIYGFLPARAHTSPPLNTGSPTNLSRLWLQVSDARDRDLRAAPAIVPESMTTNSLGAFSRTLNFLRHEWDKSINEISRPVLIPVMLFACIGALSSPLIGAASFITGLGNYLFFLGWDPDPWIPSYTLLLICAVCGLSWTLSRLRSIYVQQLLSVGVFAGVSYFTIASGSYNLLGVIRAFQLPQQFSEDFITAHANSRSIIVENSWFLLRYLQRVEGLADDKLLIYQPSLLFPGYFAQLQARRDDGKIFNSFALLSEDKVQEPLYRNLGHFIDFATNVGDVAVEPSQAINTQIRGLLTLDSHGGIVIKRGQEMSLDPKFIPALIVRYARLAEAAQTLDPVLRGDTVNFLENQLMSAVHLLEQQNLLTEARVLIEGVCQGVHSKRCGIASFNQLGLLMIGLKQFRLASDLYLELLLHKAGHSAHLKHNLVVAFEGLPQAEQETFKQLLVVQEKQAILEEVWSGR